VEIVFGDEYEKYKEALLKYISDFYFLEYDPDEDTANKHCSIFVVLNSVRVKKRVY
jgi:hypothetical protein